MGPRAYDGAGAPSRRKCGLSGSAGRSAIHRSVELPVPDSDRSAVVDDASTTPGAPWPPVIGDVAPSCRNEVGRLPNTRNNLRDSWGEAVMLGLDLPGTGKEQARKISGRGPRPPHGCTAP